MKRILFLFTASSLFLACSNDDDGGSEAAQELKIKKYTSISFDANGSLNGEMIEYLFDENGKKTKGHIIDVFGNYEWDYTYNTLGQVTKKSRNHLNYPIDIVEKYIYNENKLSYLFMDQDNNGVYEDSLRFTHQTNQIIAQWHSPGDVRKEFYYDTFGNLNATKYIGDLGIVSDELTNYNNTLNILQINYISGTTLHDYAYEYDGKTNPFYKEFQDHFFNIVWRDGGLLSTYSLFFSPNNITKITFTSTEPSENYTIETSYQYNNSNYPISSQTLLNGVLLTESTYEYY